MLLEKMLLVPRSRDTPLRDCVRAAMRETPTTSIPLFVRRGLDFLEADVKEIVDEIDGDDTEKK